MRPSPLITGILFLASLAASRLPATETIKVILRGKVTLADGSPPPATVGIQRICSDYQGDAPGPITNKKGEYIWQMDFDNMKMRACRLEAQLKGYTSSAVDISGINGFMSKEKVLEPLVLYNLSSNPRVIKEQMDDVPLSARGPWKEVQKAMRAGNVQAVAVHLKDVVAASPKFARGWDSLGIAYDTLLMSAEARDAYMHAIELDPKMTTAYVTLSREDVLAKDWQGAVNAADEAIKLDTKHNFAEVYLHRAAAEYELKNLDAAEADANKILGLSASERKFRGELVLGLILAAKGDTAGAKAHVSKYLDLAKDAPDGEFIKAYLDSLGKPEAGTLQIDPELP